MSRALKACVVLTLTLSVVLSATARAQFSETEVLRRRVDNLEKELAALKRPGAAPSRDQVAEIVRSELEEMQGPETFHVYWKNGLRLDSLNPSFKLKIGGRVMVDYAHLDADDELECLGWWCGAFEGPDDFDEYREDGYEIRRARFYMEGSIYKNAGYKLQVDFAGDEVAIKDAYLSVKNLLPGTVKVGHHHEPFSLEELTSSKYITFIERALPVQIFAPSRNMGVSVCNDAFDERMTWAVGTFFDGIEGTTEDGAAVTGRLTFLPHYEEESGNLVHTGIAYTCRSPDDYDVDIEPEEIHLAGDLCEFCVDPVDDASWLGLEGAVVFGPFSLQGEYFTGEVSGDDSASDLDADGGYVYASFFLTGEHRRYKTSSGKFNRVKPFRNFYLVDNGEEGGWGAWELAARYSHVDLEHSSPYTEKATIDGFTVGLNWYLNPNMRLMFNYVTNGIDYEFTCRDMLPEENGDGFSESIDGDVEAFMARFQVDF